ncbi:hypothetical protein F5X71_10195 [Nocardia brasiliensis]|uniref:Uncharacterized protein n=1 Tax=Nocardia brasiliensis TaxID=37326 RepID=A0A6G9XP64_NOCBR|nr:hypothetical protein [Nocardia brasiliensis]QIS02640.1 hypothetical protein F5X71_10195 [Nocardia brasiliensis]
MSMNSRHPEGGELTTVPMTVLTDHQGIVTQVVPDTPVPPPSGVPAEATAVAAAWAEGIRQLFGAGSVGALVVDAVFAIGEGATVRMRQEIDSIRVYGASVAAALDPAGALLSVTGALAQHSRGAFAPGTAAPPAAAITARRAMASRTHAPIDEFHAATALPVWYDPKLAARDDAQSVAVPAYLVEVTGDGHGRQPELWSVFVDAGDTDRVLDSWNETKHLDHR